jgi:RNA polymerase sigma-B factor
VHATFHDGEDALFARLRDDEDPSVRELAVRRYLPLAHRLAARYRHAGEPIEDLQQVAAIGLLNAVDRFDPERGTTFASFAVPTILGELRRHFRDRTWALRVPRTLQELTLRIEHTRDELTGSLGREPTVAELAQRLQVCDELVLRALELSLVRHVYPLDDTRRDDTRRDDTDMPGRLDDGYARVDDRDVLAPLLARLNASDAQIVFLRFSEDLTQEAIARRVGVSQMQVSRVLHRSIACLRSAAGR